MSSDLASRRCLPCEGGVPPLAGEELESYARQLPEWKVVRGHHISRSFSFPDFQSALDFVQQIGQLAEREGHHPELVLRWGMVQVNLWTHKIDGLAEADFVLAAKIEQLWKTRG